MLHIYGESHQSFRFAANQSETKWHEFDVVNVNDDHRNGNYDWEIRLVNPTSIEPQMGLRLDVDWGFIHAIRLKAASSGKSSLWFEQIFDRFAEVSQDELPNEAFPLRKGSILLAVAIEARRRVPYDPQGLRISGTTKRLPLKPENWVAAYRSVEENCRLPIYLREQFVEVMTSLWVDITVDQMAEAAASG